MRLELESSASLIPFTESGASERAEIVASAACGHLREGIKAAQAGDRAAARAFLLQAADTDPLNERTWLWLASISEIPEELFAFLQKVLEINPSNARALEWSAATRSLLARNFVERGIDAAEANQPNAAAEHFKQAIEHDRRSETAWLRLASISDSAEDEITILEKFLEIDPENSSAKTACAAARERGFRERLADARTAAVAGKSFEACEMLDSIMAENPDAEDAWMLRSLLAGSFDLKIDALTRVLEINPANASARAGLDSLLSIISAVSAGAPESSAIEMADDENDWDQPDNDIEITHPSSVSDTAPTEELPSIESIYARDLDFEPIDGTMFCPDQSFQSAIEETSGTADRKITSDFKAADPVEDEPVNELDAAVFEHEMAAEFDEVPAASSDPEAEYWNAASAQTSTFVSLRPLTSDEPITQEFKFDEIISGTDDSEIPFESPSNDAAFIGPHAENVECRDESRQKEDEPRFFESFEMSHPADFEAIIPAAQCSASPLIVSPQCPFCSTLNDEQAVACQTCMAILTLSDLEMLLANQNADKTVLRLAVEKMEREKLAREFDEIELIVLGIGHLNLRNLQYGYTYLHEASELNPNNVILGGQVNALLIRLEEIKNQTETQQMKPKGKTILVVDDSPTVRKLITGKLEKSGHEVFCSNDGVDALELLQDLRPDLILLDINMPRMDGYQVCKIIRSSDAIKNVPVIMISGKDGFFDLVRGRMAGTTGFITKPFGPETLMKEIENHFSNER